MALLRPGQGQQQRLLAKLGKMVNSRFVIVIWMRTVNSVWLGSYSYTCTDHVSIAAWRGEFLPTIQSMGPRFIIYRVIAQLLTATIKWWRYSGAATCGVQGDEDWIQCPKFLPQLNDISSEMSEPPTTRTRLTLLLFSYTFWLPGWLAGWWLPSFLPGVLPSLVSWDP